MAQCAMWSYGGGVGGRLSPVGAYGAPLSPGASPRMTRTVAYVPEHRQPHNSALVRTWNELDSYQEQLSINAVSSGSAMYTAVAANLPQIATNQLHARQTFVEAATNSLPGPSYTGPQISFPLTSAMLQSLLQHYAADTGVPLHSSHLCSILTQARVHFAKCPRVTRTATLSGSHKRLVVVGDLHGQLPDLLTIFVENGFPDPQGTQYVFNGDLVDRGAYSIEVLTLVLAYKLLYPETVHVNRGNHETESISTQYGLMNEVVQKYGSTHIFGLICQVFNQLPVCTVIDNSVVVVHGGVTRYDGITLAHLENVPREEADMYSTDQNALVLVDLLWTDPMPQWGRIEAGRAPGVVTFGPDVTANFLRSNGMGLLIRSHQVPSTGYGYEDMHDGKLITIFSASNYCGTQGNWGGVLVFSEPGNYTIKQYMAPPLHQVRDAVLKVDIEEPQVAPVNASIGEPATLESDAADQELRQSVVQTLHQIVVCHKADLMAHYSRVDPRGTGFVPLQTWAKGLAEVTKLDKIDWTEYQEELGLLVVEGSVAWRQFLNKYQVKVEAKWVDDLKRTVYERLTRTDLSVPSLFQVLDEGQDGMVDVAELRKAMPKLGLSMSEEQLQALLPGADRDRKVDVLTFIQSLAPRYSGDPVPPEVREVLTAIETTFATGCKTLLDMFLRFDSNKNGILELNEIQQMMIWLSTRSDQYAKFNRIDLAAKVMKAFDTNESGTVSLLEFLSCFQPAQHAVEDYGHQLVQQVAQAIYKHQDGLRVLFYRMDVSGSGGLDRSTFKEGLRSLALVDRTLTDADLELVADFVDRDSDGTISWDEFLTAFGLGSVPVSAPASGRASPAVLRSALY